MKHSVRRSCSFILANALSCCFCCRCRRAAACQFRGEEETHIHIHAHTRAALVSHLPPGTCHMPHANCCHLLPWPSLPSLGACVPLNEFTCCYVCVYESGWVSEYVCVCVWVCVSVWSCCFAGSNSSLHSFVCLAASIVVCLATFSSSFSLSLSHSLLLSLSLIKIQFKIFDLILFARRFPDAHVPLKRFAFALPFVLSELCSWPQSSAFLCECVYVHMCVYKFMHVKRHIPTHTHIVGTWATIVCQLKQQICNGNPKLFSSTLAMSKIPLFMKISLENCYKLFMLIQIGEFQNDNIIYKTMYVLLNSSHNSREV